MTSRPPLPPFSEESAIQKVRLAEDGWNTRDPERSHSLIRSIPNGATVPSFQPVEKRSSPSSTRKWARELDYRLIKELWTFRENRLAVRFAYEYHDDSGNWYRAYGNENWEFDDQGLMYARHASINELPILAADRKFHWPLGRRPDEHPGLSELGL